MGQDLHCGRRGSCQEAERPQLPPDYRLCAGLQLLLQLLHIFQAQPGRGGGGWRCRRVRLGCCGLRQAERKEPHRCCLEGRRGSSGHGMSGSRKDGIEGATVVRRHGVTHGFWCAVQPAMQ